MSVATRNREVKENVYRILENHPETRNDDKLLMLKYWAEVDGLVFDETFPLLFASKGTTPETITRSRRSIQETGEFLPTLESIRVKRKMLQEETRQYYVQR